MDTLRLSPTLHMACPGFHRSRSYAPTPSPWEAFDGDADPYSEGVFSKLPEAEDCASEQLNTMDTVRQRHTLGSERTWKEGSATGRSLLEPGMPDEGPLRYR